MMTPHGHDTPQVLDKIGDEVCPDCGDHADSAVAQVWEDADGGLHLVLRTAKPTRQIVEEIRDLMVDTLAEMDAEDAG